MRKLETNRRSFAKTITWRIIATLTTIALVFIFTRRLDWALGVGIVEVVAKMVFYYLHERVWNQISWGRIATEGE